MAYISVTTIHNLLRWALLIVAIASLVRAYTGWFGKKNWTALDMNLAMLFTSFFDLQILAGLILIFFFSPSTKVGLANPGMIMSDALSRFYFIEHMFMMLVAVVVAHIGFTKAKKAVSSFYKYRTVAIWFSISLLIVLVSIPWPFRDPGAPWLRLGSLILR